MQAFEVFTARDLCKAMALLIGLLLDLLGSEVLSAYG